MSQTDRIKVVARFRPLNQRELNKNNDYLPKINPRNTEVQFKGRKFGFDKVFGENVTQSDFYSKTAKPVIEEILQGKNSIIFAYGQTGSGKTFSMNGAFDQNKNIITETKGVIPRIIDDLFQGFDESKHTEDTETVFVKVSYVHASARNNLNYPTQKG